MGMGEKGYPPSSSQVPETVKLLRPVLSVLILYPHSGSHRHSSDAFLSRADVQLDEPPCPSPCDELWIQTHANLLQWLKAWKERG